MMKKQTIKAPLKRTAPSMMGLVLMGLTSTLLSTNSMASEYCSSPKLYATNIRESCNQFGASGLETLYQRSEFINGLKSLEQSNPAKRINNKKLNARKAS